MFFKQCNIFYRVSVDRVDTIKPDKKFSYILDEETQTTIYWNKDAEKKLEDTNFFESTNLVIIPENSIIKIEYQNRTSAIEKMTFDEPGLLIINKMSKAKIYIMNGKILLIQNNKIPFWYEHYKPGENFPNIYKTLKKYHDTGFDCHGLYWESIDKQLLFYKHSERVNCWTSEHDDWLCSSIMYGGSDGPCLISISRYSVSQKENSIIPESFFDERKREIIHKHPIRDGFKKQIEFYVVTKGKSILSFLNKDKEYYIALHEGDMALIEPETYHAIACIEPPYEQIVVQVPSTFQYGFCFKENGNQSINNTIIENSRLACKLIFGKNFRGVIDPTVILKNLQTAHKACK